MHVFSNDIYSEPWVNHPGFLWGQKYLFPHLRVLLDDGPQLAALPGVAFKCRETPSLEYLVSKAEVLRLNLFIPKMGTDSRPDSEERSQLHRSPWNQLRPCFNSITARVTNNWNSYSLPTTEGFPKTWNFQFLKQEESWEKQDDSVIISSSFSKILFHSFHPQVLILRTLGESLSHVNLCTSLQQQMRGGQQKKQAS